MVVFTKKVELVDIENQGGLLAFRVYRLTYQTSYFLFGRLVWKTKFIEDKAPSL